VSSFDVGDCVYSFFASGSIFCGLIVDVSTIGDEKVYTVREGDRETACLPADCVYETREEATRAALKWQIDNIMNEIAELDAKRRKLSGKLTKLEQELKGQDVGGTKAETQG